MFKNALKKMVLGLGLALMGTLAAPAMADTCVNLSWQPQPNLRVGVAINPAPLVAAYPAPVVAAYPAPVVVTAGYAPVIYTQPVVGWYPHPIHDRYWVEHHPVVHPWVHR